MELPIQQANVLEQVDFYQAIASIDWKQNINALDLFINETNETHIEPLVK